jgi:hypothetical protein
MKSPSEATGEEFQRPPQGEFRAPAARKSDDTTEKVQPAGVARAPLSVQMRVFGSLDDGLSIACEMHGLQAQNLSGEAIRAPPSVVRFFLRIC